MPIWKLDIWQEYREIDTYVFITLGKAAEAKSHDSYSNFHNRDISADNVFLFLVRYVEEPERIVEEVIALLHTCIPMAGCWWIILLYQDFFEWEGNELLYYYHSWRQLIKEYIFVVAVYVGVSGFIVFCIQQTIEFPFFVIVQLSAETVFIASLTLFFSFLLQNTGGVY